MTGIGMKRVGNRSQSDYFAKKDKPNIISYTKNESVKSIKNPENGRFLLSCLTCGEYLVSDETPPQFPDHKCGEADLNKFIGSMRILKLRAIELIDSFDFPTTTATAQSSAVNAASGSSPTPSPPPPQSYSVSFRCNLYSLAAAPYMDELVEKLKERISANSGTPE